jgi:hypothetical protein
MRLDLKVTGRTKKDILCFLKKLCSDIENKKSGSNKGGYYEDSHFIYFFSDTNDIHDPEEEEYLKSLGL